MSAEPTNRELTLAREIDAELLQIEHAGLYPEEHTARVVETLAGKLAAYRVELIGTNKPDVEVRYQEGELDEVIARQVDFFHLEYMDTDHVWIGLGWGEQRVAINLFANGTGMVESDGLPSVAMRVVRDGKVIDE